MGIKTIEKGREAKRGTARETWAEGEVETMGKRKNGASIYALHFNNFREYSLIPPHA